MDQRSGDGWISGWSQIFVFYQRELLVQTLSCSTRELLQHSEQNHPEYPLQEEGQSGGNESSQRRPCPSRKTDYLLDLRILPGHWGQTILSRITPTYLQLFLEMTIFRYSTQTGTEFYYQWRKSIWWHLGRIVQINNTRVWETQDRIGIVQYGDSPEESRTWLSQIEDNGKKKYRAEFEKEEFWGQKWEFWNKRRGRESGVKQREQRSLGDCCQWKADGQCSKGDSCSFRHDMNKRAESTQPNPSPRSSTQQSEKCIDNQKSQRQKSQWKNVSIAARITSKELAPLHSVKSGILPSVCSTRPRVVVGLEKSALVRTSRLMKSLAKGLKRLVTKVQWFFEDYTTIGLRNSRYGAAKVHNDFPEELKHTEAYPMCSIHKSRRTSCWHSRPKSIAWNDLLRWSSSA